MLRNSDGTSIGMGRNMAVQILDERGVERLAARRLRFEDLRVDDGDKVKRGQRLAEWDPYTTPDDDRSRGTVQFEDLVDEHVVLRSDRRSDRHHQASGHRLAFASARLGPEAGDRHQGCQTGNMKLSRGGDARFLLSVDAILSVEPGTKVSQGDVLARSPLESAKTKDITGGLPRVAELFEARRPKDHAIIAEIDGTIRFGRDYKNKRRVKIDPGRRCRAVEYLIPKGKHFHLQDGDVYRKGRLHPRRQPGIRTTSWRSRAWRRWLPTW
jgi:DNA-directed RNA polymerase subunit beta'